MRIEYHRTLIADRVRNRALMEALKKIIRKGETVVADIGAGTGLIGLMAARLGAKEVHLYEMAEVVAVADEVLKRNRVRNCHLMPCSSLDMVDPPRVDVVISETLGNYAFEEGMIDTLADARARLLAFLQPDAERARLTWAMKPTEADIRAVYADPLASKLIAAYGEMFTPDVSIGPKDAQTEVLTWYATTKELREGNPILREFPGGYKKVAGLMQGEYPILRFKFVEPGETMGLAFDGLIFVNDHWVLMPKPWRYVGD